MNDMEAQYELKELRRQIDLRRARLSELEDEIENIKLDIEAFRSKIIQLEWESEG